MKVPHGDEELKTLLYNTAYKEIAGMIEFFKILGFIVEIIKKPRITVKKIEFIGKGEKENYSRYNLIIKNIGNKNIFNFYIIDYQHGRMSYSLEKNGSRTVKIELSEGKTSEVLETYIMAKYSCMFKMGKKSIIKNYVQDIVLIGKEEMISFDVRDTKRWHTLKQ